MSTFAELENRVRLIVDEPPVSVNMLLHESENEFIRKTLCTQDQRDIKIEASTVEFDGAETNIAFVKGSGNTRDTITDSDDGFVTDGFAAGQEIVVDGSTSNDNAYTIYSVAAGTITLTSIGALTSESGVADMTIEASEIPYKVSLPSDFVIESRVEFRGIRLEKIHQRENFQFARTTTLIETGTPEGYWIEGNYLVLVPKPTQEGTLKIWYTYYNTDSTTTSPIIPTVEHFKIVNHAIATLLELQEKNNIADRYFAKFENDCRITALKYINQRFSQRKIIDIVGGGRNKNHIEERIPIVTES
jgi:hypothetical protein